MKDQRARIVVTGLAATYPFGGVFWDYMQYVQGLSLMGHDVMYLEDTGRWCYDPVGRTFSEDGTLNARYLRRSIDALDPGLSDRWHFRDPRGIRFGIPWERVVAFCRTADLFIHISASCWMRDEYFAADRVAFIDSDPMYTQASVPAYVSGTADDAARARIDMLRRHDVFFTFGENVGADSCLIPTDLFAWRPTRQPVVLSAFEPWRVPVRSRRRMLTTVASWQSTEGSTKVGDRSYGGKDVELERFEDVPGRSPVPLELALSGLAPYERLRSRGWGIVDAYAVSSDPWRYRDYLAGSLAEWSVAKEAYVASHSGWFSCRTACYLALGVPAVVQDTGFVIPSGSGVLSFQTLEEAIAAIDKVSEEPDHHSEAAIEIAHTYFDAPVVLGALVDEAFAAEPSTRHMAPAAER
jgi:hypothetical protein